jgi:hypothetical protein
MDTIRYRKRLLTATFTCLASISMQAYSASYLYSYLGYPYFIPSGSTPTFTSSMRISGHFSVPTRLDPGLSAVKIAPTSFSFNNGVETITEAPGTSSSGFTVSTDESGQIRDWSISIADSIPADAEIGYRIQGMSTKPAKDYTYIGEFLGKSSSGLNIIEIIEQAETPGPGTWTITTVLPIDITADNQDDSVIDLKRDKTIKVTILTETEFDAIQIDPPTVKLGPGGANPVRYQVKDVDHDGDADLVLSFKTADLGLAECDTAAILYGQSYSGEFIQGTDTFTTAACQ